MGHRITIWLGLTACLLPISARAQQPALDSPETVARTLIEADARRDWKTILRLAHPAALQEFKSSQIEFIEMDSDTSLRKLEAEHGGRARSTPSPWVSLMLDRVFHVPNLGALKSLAPDSVLARFIRIPGMREPIEDSAIARDARVIPGSLIDGDSVAFVIIRRTDWRTPDSLRARFGGAELMTLRRYQGQWRSMLDGGVLYARNGMAFGFIREDSEPPHDP